MDSKIKPTIEKKDVLKNILTKITEFTTGIKQNSHTMPGTGNDLLQWVLEDDDLRAGIEKKHGKLSQVGYFLKGKDGKAVPKTVYEKLEKLRFDEWYDNSWFQELIYKNSFTELASNPSGEIESLNLIKTDEVEIVNSPNGIVTNYLQLPTNQEGSVKQVITLPAERILHIAYNRYSTSLWGVSELITLIPVLHKKRLIEDFIAWLFESNQFRSVIKIPSGVNDDDVEVYLEMLKNGMKNPTNFLVLQGDEATVTSLRAFEGFRELLSMLDYYQSKINKLLQLPPLEMGNVESSNRSSSEYQVRYAYYSHIESLLKRKADQINNELFPRLGIKNVIFVNNLVDDISKKDLLENAQKLLSLNADVEKLNEWIIEQGLNIPKGLLKEPEDDFEGVPMGSQNKQKQEKSSKLKLDKNSDQHPSRKKTESDMAGGSRTK